MIDGAERTETLMTEERGIASRLAPGAYHIRRDRSMRS